MRIGRFNGAPDDDAALHSPYHVGRFRLRNIHQSPIVVYLDFTDGAAGQARAFRNGGYDVIGRDAV